MASGSQIARGRSGALAALLLAVIVGGCSTLPTEGEVRTRPDAGNGSGAQAPYFAPPGPTPGDDREGIVRGFLLAMQANPPSTAVARAFLTRKAASTWNPDQATIVYDSSGVESSSDGVIRARLSEAHVLDARGAWDAEAAAPSTSLDFSLEREDGEWRITSPPRELAVPASYFSSLFVPFHLYFFDRSGTVLVPERVYLPRGEQTATNLLRGLLGGPRAAETEALVSALPPDSELDRGVLVNDSGIAQVPLGRAVLRLGPAAMERLLAQLCRTLRQVPGVTRLRLTVDGLSVPLPNGQTDISVRTGVGFDPVAMPERTPFGLVGNRVVRFTDDGADPVGGPLGRPGFALRTLAVDPERNRVAAVAANGRRLYLARDTGPVRAAAVQVPLDGANDLLRPDFDRFGALWSIDRTATGAVVHVSRGGVDRVVTVRGITGQRVTGFTLTRDGSRMAAVLAGGDTPRIVVAPLVRDGEGRFLRSGRPTDLDVGGAELGTVRDVGQAGPTTLAVLTQPASGPGRIVIVELDASPGTPGVGTPGLVPGEVLALASGPAPEVPVRVVTGEGRMLVLDGTGEWVESDVTDVRAVVYPG